MGRNEEERDADALSAENVRRFLDGTIVGEPLPGTLAHRVYQYGECNCFSASERAQ